jgi:hypothetical protein
LKPGETKIKRKISRRGDNNGKKEDEEHVTEKEVRK